MSALIFAIVFFSGHAVGVAGKDQCKEAIAAGTGFAIPPRVFRGKQEVVACTVYYQHPELPPHQQCLYAAPDKSACSVLFDMPGEKQFRVLAIDCNDGTPLKEQKL